MTIDVSPTEFRLVEYDAAAIAAAARHVAALVGAGERTIHVVVDETTPLSRITAERGGDGSITVHADSGALEDTRRPRHLSSAAAHVALGRVLLRALDRERAEFADAPAADGELTLPQLAAWDTTCVGRLARLGVPVHQQRWRYNFRNRHGFTDAADAAFERLWACDRPTWAMINS